MATTDGTPGRAFSRHEESSATIRAAPESVFAFLDTHENIAAHMNRPNWAMLGGSMTTAIDNLAGKAVGSVIRIEGKVLGISLSLAEKIVRHEPPRLKSWETIGIPRLIVIGGYSMGFYIIPAGDGCLVTVYIDYEFPLNRPGQWLGRLLGPAYARWCINRIIEAAMKTPRN